MRRTLQIVVVAAGALAALAGLLVGLFFAATAGPVGAADAFFDAVRARDLAAAARAASAEFRASTGDAALQEHLERTGLARARRVRWTSRGLTLGGPARLDGVAETDEARSVPLHVTLAKEGDGWKVHGLDLPAAGLVDLGLPEGAPGPAEQLALLRASVQALGLALRSEDFGPFRAGVARAWQVDADAAGFREMFRGVRFDLARLAALAPEPDAPATIERGVLAVRARYQLADGRLHVLCKYVHEGLAWKLAGFHLSPKPLEP